MLKYLLILNLIFIAGCTSETRYGPCVGAFSEKAPDLKYKINTWNIVVSIILSQTLVVPVVVIAEETYCPVGVKRRGI